MTKQTPRIPAEVTSFDTEGIAQPNTKVASVYLPRLTSRVVDWWPVHEYVTDRITAETWPMAGTLDWQHLPERHPEKIAAILDAAQHWALRVQLAQEAMAEASQEISASEDWKALVQSLDRGRAYIPRWAS